MALTDAQKDAKIIYADGIHEITLAGTVVQGDAVGYDSGWKRALATAGTAIQMRCVALQDGVSGDVIKAAFGSAIIGGSRFSGTTVGGAVYVAEGSDNGQYTETEPSTTNDCNTVVGMAIAADTLLLKPNSNPDSTHA